jgi:hypothetical protein
MKFQWLLFLIAINSYADSLSLIGITAHLPGTISPGTEAFMPNKLDSSGVFVYNVEALYTHEERSSVIKGGFLKDSFNDNAGLLVVSNKSIVNRDNGYLGYGGGVYVRETLHRVKGNVEYRSASPVQISNGHYDLLVTPGIVGSKKLSSSMSLDLVSNILLTNVSLAYNF